MGDQTFPENGNPEKHRFYGGPTERMIKVHSFRVFWVIWENRGFLGDQIGKYFMGDQQFLWGDQLFFNGEQEIKKIKLFFIELKKKYTIV